MVYLSLWEKHWTIFYKALSERGYTLRKRYNLAGESVSGPDSRIDSDPTTKEYLYRFMVSVPKCLITLPPLLIMHLEGGLQTHNAAIRRSDNQRVMIKVLSSPFREHLALHEHEIHTWLLSDGRDKDPANHTVRIFETLRLTAIDYDASLIPGVTEDTPVYYSLKTEC